MNDLKIVDERIVLDKNFRIYGTIENPLFLAKDVAEWIEHSNITKMLNNIDEEDKIKIRPNKSLGQLTSNNEYNFLTEDGLYEVLMQSRKPISKEFKKQVKNILKTIRKTGGYVANDNMFIDTYLPFADDNTKLLFTTTLQTIRKQNEIISKQKSQIELQKKEITYKEDVIIGLVENIDLATKRQRITQIIRKGAKNNYANRYGLLYSEFERKFHCDLDRRIQNCEIKPKIKNKMDYIDREMNMIPQLYEITCKLFENDVKILQSEWETTL